ncbi:MAG TPA: transglycosylase domain-containing protein [Burkholderiaceae bacterium]|nr:transglycosylase domain-containing protein [Burkholderiaceae bacterium]
MISLLVSLAPVMAFAIVDEIETSRWQATLMSVVAGKLWFRVEPGPSDAITFPATGPYDERLGYDRLPEFIARLEEQGFAITAQGRMSPWMLALADHGFFPPYREKSRLGLALRGCRGEPIFAARFPERAYPRFEDVPRVLVDAVLFIENQGLLDDRRPTRNPAVEWDRFAGAVGDQVLHVLHAGHPTPGASTLATQIEKYRHSPDGRTESGGEKLRQMTSAMLRAYLDGADTRSRRQQIVLDYINTVPLSAKAGFGEVNGFGDGLWAWYGRDFTEVSQLLAGARDASPRPAGLLDARARAFKQVLSLMIAERRPSYYLPDGEHALTDLTDSYLRLMADANVIPAALRDAALPLPLDVLGGPVPRAAMSFVDHKAASAVRGRLSTLLEIPRPYDLNRLDLVAGTTLDGDAQRAATRLLRAISDPAAARDAGLYGYHLLENGDDPGKLVFSFTLFERSEGANLLRVQTDSVDQPFDINEGARLDLGSTAKLRTLITYLEQVADLHRRWVGLSPAELAAVGVDRRDAIARWAVDYLSQAKDRSLGGMLDAAMQRTYSASPYEAFFTGGGMHRFENFEPEDNGRVLTVREAFKRSVNLVFIRLMRDVVNHVIAETPDANAWPLERRAATSRAALLARFADQESRQFIARFYRKYQGLSPGQAEELLLQSVRPTPVRLANVFAVLEPEGSVDDLAEFLARRIEREVPLPAAVKALHDRQSNARGALGDHALVAGVHPLELWLVGYLRHHPGATLSEANAASQAQRYDAYRWLFTTPRKIAQDERIRIELEQQAFAEILRSWRRLGYPFEALTPSYATAIGSSGDRPTALAELMGVIVNRGMRRPVNRIESLSFARGTPYETRLDYRTPAAERLLAPEIADTVRRSLIDVVEGGTAARLNHALVRSDGEVIVVGGKTGTGDHRFEVFGRGGQLVSSRVVSRSATFVFLIGDRYFGTMMAYVPEPDAARYRFTSALPVQLLKVMLPEVVPGLERSACSADGAAGG